MVEGLYHRHPNESPGSLTVMRHSRHSDHCLAAFCATSDLADLIEDVTFEARNLISRFTKSIKAAKKLADEQVDVASRLEFWTSIPGFSVRPSPANLSIARTN